MFKAVFVVVKLIIQIEEIYIHMKDIKDIKEHLESISIM